MSKKLSVLKWVGVFLNCNAPNTNFSIEMNHKLSREAVETVLGLDGFGVLLKDHPRSKEGFVDSVLKGFDTSRVKLVDTPALILSQYCRVSIIIGDSSVCLDMLAGGVPVIMYFRNEVKCFNRNYLNLGLVAEAHTMNELKDWIIKLN